MLSKCKIRNENATVTGMVNNTTKLERQERKKRIITKKAKNNPSYIVFIVPSILSVTKAD
jgi:hypothetical protein